MAGSLNATWRASPLRQSSSMAIPSRPMTAMDWSMIPQGAPAKSFSARWQRAARSCPSIARGAPAAACSRAAEPCKPERVWRPPHRPRHSPWRPLAKLLGWPGRTKECDAPGWRKHLLTYIKEMPLIGLFDDIRGETK